MGSAAYPRPHTIGEAQIHTGTTRTSHSTQLNTSLFISKTAFIGDSAYLQHYNNDNSRLVNIGLSSFHTISRWSDRAREQGEWRGRRRLISPHQSSSMGFVADESTLCNNRCLPSTVSYERVLANIIINILPQNTESTDTLTLRQVLLVKHRMDEPDFTYQIRFA